MLLLLALHALELLVVALLVLELLVVALLVPKLLVVALLVLELLVVPNSDCAFSKRLNAKIPAARSCRSATPLVWVVLVLSLGLP